MLAVALRATRHATPSRLHALRHAPRRTMAGRKGRWRKDKASPDTNALMKTSPLVRTQKGGDGGGGGAGGGGQGGQSMLLYQMFGVVGVAAAVVGWLEVIYHPGKYNNFKFEIPGNYQDEVPVEDNDAHEDGYLGEDSHQRDMGEHDMGEFHQEDNDLYDTGQEGQDPYARGNRRSNGGGGGGGSGGGSGTWA